MYYRLYLAIIILFGCSTCDAVEPYPAVNTRYFSGGTLDTSYNEKLIAVEGLITRIESGPAGKPLIQIMLPNPIMKELWIGSLVADEDSLLKQGHIIRVLGYLNSVDSETSELTGLSSDDYFVLGFCILNISEMKELFLNAGLKQCKSWKNGAEAGDL
jgi:hypothetical protein